MRVIFLACLIFSLILTGTANPVSSDCSSTVCFSLQRKVAARDLSLIASKLFRYYFWTAYSIALYADPAELKNRNILSDSHKSLILHYHRDFAAADIIAAADKLLKSNPETDLKSIEAQVEEINSLYVDIKEGDSYALDYVPGQGTSLLLNNRLLGTVKGEEFARAYFGIWLSEYSLSDSLTRDLIAPLAAKS